MDIADKVFKFRDEMLLLLGLLQAERVSVCVNALLDCGMQQRTLRDIFMNGGSAHPCSVSVYVCLRVRVRVCQQCHTSLPGLYAHRSVLRLFDGDIRYQDQGPDFQKILGKILSLA